MSEMKPMYMWPSWWSRPVVHGGGGAVSCNNVYAARAGLEILKKGGNAFDAAAAVSLALSVTEPHHSGIGGGCFSLLYDHRMGQTFALDGRGVAPKKAGADLFLKNGVVQDEWKDLGGRSVAVPGLLRTLEEILGRFGTMTMSQAAEYAVRYAREGFGTGYTYVLTMQDDSVQRKLKRSEEFKRLYVRQDGVCYRFGEIQKNEKLADFIEETAAEGSRRFYEGETARAIVEAVNDQGGIFEAEDLREYRPKYRDPVQTDYRGLQVAAFAPPGGGCTLAEMLNILENSDIKAMGHNTAQSIHLLTEAMKLSFADRSVAMGDSDFVKVDVETVAGKPHAARRFSLIGETAGEYAPAEGIEAAEYPGNTSHFSIMDAQGNAVSQTQTVRDWFGSGIAVKEGGFVLNNAMSDFSAALGASTSQGLSYGNANRIEGGKTPLSSMCPAIIFKEGRPFLAIGSAGGPRIITGTLQGIVNAVDFGMKPEQLVDQPYVNCLTREQGLEAEPGISGDTLKLLADKGHKIIPIPSGSAMSTMVNSVMYENGTFYAAGTKRVDGCGGVLTEEGNFLLEGISQE